MSETGNRKTVTELDEALRLLDYELAGLNLEEPLQIRAIGGYALLKHGVRKGDNAYTVDIDTVTANYSVAVTRAIEKVAEQASLDPDWLNNYNLMDDPEQVEAMLEAEWLPQPMDLRNIAVSIASIPTLTRAKIIAADTAEFSGRVRDGSDLRDLLDYQGISTLGQFNSKYPDPFDEYPDARQLVRNHLSPGTRFPELRGVTLDAYDDDGYADDVDLDREDDFSVG